MLIMLRRFRVKLNQQLNNQEYCSLALLPNFSENMCFHFSITKYAFKTSNPHSNS